MTIEAIIHTVNEDYFKIVDYRDVRWKTNSRGRPWMIAVDVNSKTFEETIRFNEAIDYEEYSQRIRVTFSAVSTTQELEQDEWINIGFDRHSYTAGECYGTLYDDSDQCPFCALGAKQVGPLRLGGKAIVQSRDCYTNFASEIVVKDKVIAAVERATCVRMNAAPVLFPKRSKRSNDQQIDKYGQRLHQLVIDDYCFALSENANLHLDFDFFSAKNFRSNCPFRHTVDSNVYGPVVLTMESNPKGKICATTTSFRGASKMSLLRPWHIILIHNDIYRAFINMNVTGLLYIPVTIE